MSEEVSSTESSTESTDTAESSTESVDNKRSTWAEVEEESKEYAADDHEEEVEEEAAEEEAEEVEETPKPEKKKRKGKVDGQDVELEATDDELWEAYQKKAAADKRFAEASKKEKEVAALVEDVEAFARALKEDTVGTLIKAGIYENDDALLEKVVENITQKLNTPELTPEQKELQAEREAKAELARQLEELKKAEYTREFVSGSTEALTAAGLPVNTRSIADLAYVMDSYLKRSDDLVKSGKAALPDMSYADAARAVDNYYNGMTNEIISGSDDEKLLERITPENLEKLVRLYSLRNKKVTSPSTARVRPGKPAAKGDVDPDVAEQAKYVWERMKNMP